MRRRRRKRPGPSTRNWGCAPGAGPPRIGVFLAGGDPAALLPEAVRRATRYLAAGADCVYPILLADPAILAELVAAVPGAVNALARPGAPTVPELAALGVARVSYGGGLYAAARGHTQRMLDVVRAGGDPFAAVRPAASG
ncbi:isocitrate lyase/phosphoenolpyruvate mutase family protein [Micromonospora sp. DT62]|uniref:isocitrate lyase/phosphoenolpyruvate mutase family protein n=1 Tax=Micromonospora sp. DT62 TaxID=3416521 RepID=UPI003CF6C5D3